ncbi:hypothetical protein AN964_07030 [Heyndrickxia shackletonii]|uniref:DUF4367 domain-containing protein n=1 Tax=Heyndrickxia shackletonii TaxID=157838 RepID=A0A0Q3WX08_9BACI|nr:hypothetical protein [Heyndrickxia shackletonii]KQL53267.1 hypothetical protein AN964_07030 [Heyndrickxia shackletonii]NEZ02153.1 hypothetical protein [Heyndrickxia shackletonii]
MGMLLVFVIALISGCSTSIKEQQKEAVKNVNEAFSNQPKAAKKSTKHLKLYLPFGMAIQKDSPNNVIMKRGNQNYLLFYNQKVDKKGKEVYKISKPNKGILLDKNFTSKEKFGYLFVSKVKKNLYEVTVGIGGIKMTTETDMKNIASDAEKMMKIVSSVKYRK